MYPLTSLRRAQYRSLLKYDDVRDIPKYLRDAICAMEWTNELFYTLTNDPEDRFYAKLMAVISTRPGRNTNPTLTVLLRRNIAREYWWPLGGQSSVIHTHFVTFIIMQSLAYGVTLNIRHMLWIANFVCIDWRRFSSLGENHDPLPADTEREMQKYGFEIRYAKRDVARIPYRDPATYVFTIALIEGILRLDAGASDAIVRYFAIMQRLPLELQMHVSAFRVVSAHDFEISFCRWI